METEKLKEILELHEKWLRSEDGGMKADLRWANLSRAHLSRADLSGANLSRADLSEADLSRADLSVANLSGANLSGACLSGACLRGAYLRGANLNWNSHDLVAEILRRAAGEEVKKLMLAGLPVVTRDKCWDWFLAQPFDDDTKNWALNELAKWVKDGDNAPEELAARAEPRRKKEVQA